MLAKTGCSAAVLCGLWLSYKVPCWRGKPPPPKKIVCQQAARAAAGVTASAVLQAAECCTRLLRDASLS